MPFKLVQQIKNQSSSTSPRIKLYITASVSSSFTSRNIPIILLNKTCIVPSIQIKAGLQHKEPIYILPLSSLIIKSFRKSNYLNCSLHLNVLLLNQIKTESEVVNMVDSDTISLQIKNLYQTIFAVPLAQGVTWAV